MDLKEYIDGCKRTESSKAPLVQSVIDLGLTNRMLHAIIGIETEMGEVAEAYENIHRAGRIDYVNVAEEVGDAYWYTGVLFDELDIARVDAPDLVGIDSNTAPLELFSQAADMLDKCKKTMFYGKEFNEAVLHEQIVRFYVTLGRFVDGLGEHLTVTKEKIWEINLRKLKIRYPEKFDMTDAEVRDLEAERIVLETAK